jgi:hypothetical protein
MVMTVRGSHRQRPNTATTLLVVILVVAALCGLTLLAGE